MITGLNKSVFFHTCNSCGTPEAANFHHLSIDLAGGLKKLGVHYYSSNNYWNLSLDDDDFLFRADDQVNHHDCDIVVIDRIWFEMYGALPNDLFRKDRKYTTVYLDCSDGIKTSSWLPEFRQFDYILKTHCSKNISRPENIYPWAFGLSSRVISELKNPSLFKSRTKSLLVNFRHQSRFSHSLRKFIERNFLKDVEDHFLIDSSINSVSPRNGYPHLLWAQTGRRHYPSYYERLEGAAACACFGGYFLAPRFTDLSSKTSYYLARLISELGIKTNGVPQWDRWRLWESLAAGCVTFHLDFEKYGFELPVTPINWEHYIGIDLDNMQDTIDRIEEQPEMLEKISAKGKSWALSNYSPKVSALRFLKIASSSRYLDCMLSS